MSLCLECGFCCDGTLFGKVPIDPEETAVPFEALGAAPGAATFEQPCSALRGTACSVYAQRPSTCRKFRCSALRGLEDGNATLEEAREQLGEVRARRDVVAGLVSAPTGGAAIKAARLLVKDGRASGELAEALHRFERLVLFLES